MLFSNGLNSPPKVLIYRIGNIGDTVCAIPAMRMLRKTFPEAHMTLLTSPGKRGMPGAGELLEGADFLDEMIIYHHEEISNWKGRLKLLLALRHKHFDLFVELPNDLGTFHTFVRDILFAKALGCRNAIGFQPSPVVSSKRSQNPPSPPLHEIDRLLRVLEEEGFGRAAPVFRLPIRRTDEEFAEDLLRLNGIGPDDLCVALNPGAKRPANRWAEENFIQVGRILTRHLGMKVCVLGGTDERSLAERVAEAVGECAISLAGKTTLLQAAALLRRCLLLVSNDTGTAHLAAAVATPVVAVFSARDVGGKWYPYGDRNIVLRQEIECQLCFKEECDHQTCLKNIPVEAVVSACHQILSRIRRHEPAPAEQS